VGPPKGCHQVAPPHGTMVLGPWYCPVRSQLPGSCHLPWVEGGRAQGGKEGGWKRWYKGHMGMTSRYKCTWQYKVRIRGQQLGGRWSWRQGMSKEGGVGQGLGQYQGSTRDTSSTTRLMSEHDDVA
jgi:hypothetical protein